MTVKMFASAPWPPSVPVSNVPSQPCCWDSSWACWSWPRLTFSVTSSQSMPPSVVEPSSASETVMWNGTMSPKSAILPSSGMSIVTSGRELPATIGTESVPFRPPASVTVSLALKLPAVAYVCDGFGSVESVVPSPSKSHS